MRTTIGSFIFEVLRIMQNHIERIEPEFILSAIRLASPQERAELLLKLAQPEVRDAAMLTEQHRTDEALRKFALGLGKEVACEMITHAMTRTSRILHEDGAPVSNAVDVQRTLLDDMLGRVPDSESYVWRISLKAVWQLIRTKKPWEIADEVTADIILHLVLCRILDKRQICARLDGAWQEKGLMKLSYLDLAKQHTPVHVWSTVLLPVVKGYLDALEVGDRETITDGVAPAAKEIDDTHPADDSTATDGVWANSPLEMSPWEALATGSGFGQDAPDATQPGSQPSSEDAAQASTAAAPQAGEPDIWADLNDELGLPPSSPPANDPSPAAAPVAQGGSFDDGAPVTLREVPPAGGSGVMPILDAPIYVSPQRNNAPWVPEDPMSGTIRAPMGVVGSLAAIAAFGCTVVLMFAILPPPQESPEAEGGHLKKAAMSLRVATSASQTQLAATTEHPRAKDPAPMGPPPPSAVAITPSSPAEAQQTRVLEVARPPMAIAVASLAEQEDEGKPTLEEAHAARQRALEYLRNLAPPEKINAAEALLLSGAWPSFDTREEDAAARLAIASILQRLRPDLYPKGKQPWLEISQRQWLQERLLHHLSQQERLASLVASLKTNLPVAATTSEGR